MTADSGFFTKQKHFIRASKKPPFKVCRKYSGAHSCCNSSLSWRDAMGGRTGNRYSLRSRNIGARAISISAVMAGRRELSRRRLRRRCRSFRAGGNRCPLVLFGHSLGAMVAAAVAAEVPDRVRAIILEDPPFHTLGNRIEGSAWQAQFIGMQEIARRGGSVEDITDALAEIRLPSGGAAIASVNGATAPRWRGVECARSHPTRPRGVHTRHRK